MAQKEGANMSYLRLKNARKSFGALTVVDDLDLNIEKGQLITLLGPSGCGKSTLLRSIAGLEFLDSGSIILNGRDITHARPQNRNIAMVFQHYALFPNMTVADNVGFGLKIRKLPIENRLRKVKEALELVELTEFSQQKPAFLSGGQKQRVALARALVMEPDLLLLDEPLSALDAKLRKSLRQQIKHIHKELGLTTIFVTHDQEEALALSDKVVLLNKGRIEQHSTPEKLYSQPNSKFTAGFIGNYNIGRFNCLNKLPIGQLDMAIRPEAIQINSTNGDVAGKIIDRTLTGGVVRYQVKTDEGEVLDVDVLNYGEASKLIINDSVYLTIPEDEVITMA